MTMLTVVVAALLLSLVISPFVVSRVIAWSPRLGLFDRPSSRSLHVATTPRGGGIAIAACTLVGTTLWAALAGEWSIWPFLVGGMAIAVVGLIDDLISLPAFPRFAVHLGAATLVVWGFGPFRVLGVGPYELALGVGAVPLTLLWLVGLTNAYNFMDGIDGLAGCQAVTAAGFWLLAVGPSGSAITIPVALIAGSSLGFLIYNWPPARIFMGDVGSGFLGFSFAAVAVMAARDGRPELPIAGGLFVGIFLFDAALTLVRRLLARERLYQAHRSHLYQRLVSAGWSHRDTTTLLVALACVIGASGQAILHGPERVELPSLVVALALLAAYAAFVTRVEKNVHASAR